MEKLIQHIHNKNVIEKLVMSYLMLKFVNIKWYIYPIFLFAPASTLTPRKETIKIWQEHCWQSRNILKNCKENLTNTYESRADGTQLCKIRCTSFDEPTYHVEKQEASAGQYSDWSVQ